MSKKIKKGPHPHDKKERQQIAGCPRCRGKEIVMPPAQEADPAPSLAGMVCIGTITTSAESPEDLAAATFTFQHISDSSGLAPLEVLPLSSVPLESEPAEEPEAPPVVAEGFSPH